MKDATESGFKVLGDGYATDGFNAFYKGREIEDAAVTSFKVLKDGYARDSFNAYYKGRKMD